MRWPISSGKYPGQVIGIRQANDPRLQGPGIVACDAEDREGLARLFDRHRFASVLDCAGNCALKSCELDPAMAWRINVEGVQNLVAQSVRHGARLVHLSVDLVFSGSKGGDYVEDDPTDPVTVYGKTMVVGEQVGAGGGSGGVHPADFAAHGDEPERARRGHRLDQLPVQESGGRRRSTSTKSAHRPTPTCLSRLCEAALADGLTGIYHAGAPRRLSLYQIAQIINRVGGYDPNCLFGIPRSHAGPIPPRAGNVAMNCDKLVRALGYQPFDPWPLDDALVPTHRDWHRERPAGEPRSPQHLLGVLANNPREVAGGGGRGDGEGHGRSVE